MKRTSGSFGPENVRFAYPMDKRSNSVKLTADGGNCMGTSGHTIGQAIDQIINALEPLEKNARKTAIAAVCGHLEIQLQVAEDGVSTQQVAHTPVQAAAATQTPLEPVDIRSLRAAKAPANSIQMACVVAFYLKELAQGDERKDTTNAQDLERYFKQAGFKLPSRISQTLIDAKAAGYMDSAGRGEYKLNAVGYNLVAHNLPTKKE